MRCAKSHSWHGRAVAASEEQPGPRLRCHNSKLWNAVSSGPVLQRSHVCSEATVAHDKSHRRHSMHSNPDMLGQLGTAKVWHSSTGREGSTCFSFSSLGLLLQHIIAPWQTATCMCYRLSIFLIYVFCIHMYCSISRMQSQISTIIMQPDYIFLLHIYI